ncbi:hypothetical protein BAUCODRAFT_124636 [Baudoinia panamericana UAMH 10762]|uniref:Zn(2)-C6 fungal-type domain-containing protein n=1 Tax=Baudoinia panamericana (strain UAMH 10762) TaxID=717646 RepID=M2N4D8_BAUPA|nr:uncharacterized protein BAUCODRAFT_124636 [Baudoinia panamericana UAMH 10762]EMC93884.1 hypothetical protein BAUCODRAFT_124636 [Baudoinia panamericana UAMH 10762]
METASEDSPGQKSPSSKRARVNLACKRCKHRKQRCDGSQPQCTSCRKVKVDCVYERVLRPQYPGGKTQYIGALEERVAFLESRLPEYGRDHYTAPSRLEDRHDQLPTTQPGEQRDSKLVDGVAYLSLCASGATDAEPEPFYVGNSSGATVARLLQASIFRPLKDSDDGLLNHASAMGVLRPNSAHATDKCPSAEAFAMPVGGEAAHLFHVFFERMHTRWPVLDRKLYAALFQAQLADPGSLTIVQRSIFHLLFAITARFLHLMKKPSSVDPEAQLLAAIEPMEYILEQRNISTLQFLCLLVVYGHRAPYGGGTWSQIRYAMTLAMELGLHRKRRSLSASSTRDTEIRSRVFWALYCLDRMSSTTLGRPFAISDREVDADLPVSNVATFDLTNLTDEHHIDHGWSNVVPFLHIVRLRRIQSRVQGFLFRCDKDVLAAVSSNDSGTNAKLNSMLMDMDAWRDDIPQPSIQSETARWMVDPEAAYHDSREYFDLQYHKTLLSIFVALLPNLQADDHRFSAGLRSASAVCKTYKKLNQQRILSYTITALHSCFVAGLTLVYCLWRERSLFDYDAMEAIQACTQICTIFGEKWPGAVKYRDMFDALAGTLMKAAMSSTTHSYHEQGLPLSDPACRTTSTGLPMKEAVCDIQQEAPGGWQAVRMLDEMLGYGGDHLPEQQYSDIEAGIQPATFYYDQAVDWSQTGDPMWSLY